MVEHAVRALFDELAQSDGVFLRAIYVIGFFKSDVFSSFADALETAAASDAYKKFNEDKGFANVFLRGEDVAADLQTTWDAIEPIAELAKQK